MKDNRLGIYLKNLRKEKGFTQKYVAEKLGILRQTYSHYETGRIIPPYLMLCKLSELYSIPIENVGRFIVEKERTEKQAESYLSLNQEEKELINYYRCLDEIGKAEMKEYTEYRNWKANTVKENKGK